MFNDVDRRQHVGAVRHPRDAAFPLVAPCGPAAGESESAVVAAASAFSAVAAGAASAALLSAPTSVPAAVLVRQCASWAGVLTYAGPTAAGDGDVRRRCQWGGGGGDCGGTVYAQQRRWWRGGVNKEHQREKLQLQRQQHVVGPQSL